MPPRRCCPPLPVRPRAVLLVAGLIGCHAASAPDRAGPVATARPLEPPATPSIAAAAPDPPPAAPSPPPLAPSLPPATEAAERVMTMLERIDRSLVKTRFQAQTIVNEQRGVFYWDCSGMADWILRRAAPSARGAIVRGRPLARDFYDIIARSPADGPRRGWMRLDRPELLRPGDLFAWLRPPEWKRPNTGHVGFIVSTARRHPRYADVWLMRIADATTVRHGDDSRPRGGDGGFGTGTIAFHFDAHGLPRAYGWYGVRQPPETFVPTEITFGRVFE